MTFGSAEMVQEFRALAALAGNLGSTHSNHRYSCLHSLGDPTLPSGLCRHYTNIYSGKHSYKHKIKVNKISKILYKILFVVYILKIQTKDTFILLKYIQNIKILLVRFWYLSKIISNDMSCYKQYLQCYDKNKSHIFKVFYDILLERMICYLLDWYLKCYTDYFLDRNSFKTLTTTCFTFLVIKLKYSLLPLPLDFV